MRRNLVTRTIKSTKVIALVTDLEQETTGRREFLIPRTYEKPEQVLKTVRKIYNSDKLMVNKILGTEILEARYGMDEADFIQNAFIIPAREQAEETDNDNE